MTRKRNGTWTGRLRSVLFLGACILGPTPSLAGPSSDGAATPIVTTGAIVRFRFDPNQGWTEGRVVSVSEESLRVRIRDATDHTIARGRVHRLEVRHSTSGVGRGAKWGVGVGVALGTFLAVSMLSSSDDFIDMSNYAPVGFGFGVGAGALLGTLVGAAIPVQRWEQVDTRTYSLRHRHAERFVGVRLGLRF